MSRCPSQHINDSVGDAIGELEQIFFRVNAIPSAALITQLSDAEIRARLLEIRSVGAWTCLRSNSEEAETANSPATPNTKQASFARD
jgi:hypothetical protein